MCLPFLEWFGVWFVGWTFLQLDHVHNALRHCREKQTPKTKALNSSWSTSTQTIIISCPSSVARTSQAQTSPFAQTERHASSRCCTQESMFCEQLDHDLQVLCPDGSKGWTGGAAFCSLWILKLMECSSPYIETWRGESPSFPPSRWMCLFSQWCQGKNYLKWCPLV